MKKNKIGFTFVEILVAIAILSIVSIFALSWFGKNFEIQSVNEELTFFRDNLEDLEKKLTKQFSDYEISLFLGELYFYTVNKNYLPQTQKILDFQSYTWYIQTATGTDISHIFAQELLIFSHSGSQNYEYDFSQYPNYKIETYHEKSILNPIYVSHYSQIKKESKIHLSEIRSQSQSYTGVLIKNNIGQKRQFLTYTGQTIPGSLFLTFESNDWVQVQLTLTP